MKKLISILLLILLFAGCAENPAPSGADSAAPSVSESSTEAAAPEYSRWQVAMVSDYGPVTNEIHKQDSCEAARAWCEENSVEFRVYEPKNDSTEDRIKAIRQAVADGAKVLLLPGFTFANAIVETVEQYPEVYFIATGVTDYDLQDAKGTVDDFSYVCPENLFCLNNREEIGGYLAGYAAVAAGYNKFGVLLHMAVPQRLRLFYGFMQGVDAAAAALGRTGEIELRHVQINTYSVDEDAVRALLDAWDDAGTEMVFMIPLMDSFYKPLAEKTAAGVEMLPAADDSVYWADETASEKLALQVRQYYSVSVRRMLTELIVNENWSAYGGKVEKLGLVSEDPGQNDIGLALPLKLGENFTEEDYKALVAALYRGELTVSGEIGQEPQLDIAVIHDDLPG